MRIINATENKIPITDIDRGNVGGQELGIYENWNSKGDSVVPAGSGNYIDVLDTEKVMLSTALGQIKTLVAASKVTTEYSITGREVGPFNLTSLNNTFEIIADTGTQSFTLPTGSAVAMADIVSLINLSATGFVAEESTRFFRSTNTDRIIGAEADGPGGVGYGVRGDSIISGFLVLHGSKKITIGSGTANEVLGFTADDFTKSM